MTSKTKPLYVGALRMKAGELAGVKHLAPDVAERFTPRFIIPPLCERRDELQLHLLADEHFPDISAALAANWPRRDALIESSYIIDEFGRDRMSIWLPRMFESARKSNTNPVPLVKADELLMRDISCYKDCIDTCSDLKFGIIFSLGDMGDIDFLKKILEAIEKLSLTPADCIVIADFNDADFENADLVAPIIGGILETLQSSALWQQIVFQGTNFPEKNPATPGSSSIVARNEWIAWRKAVRFEPETADYMIFGDYVADCAKLVFKKGGSARPIRHYRYTTPEGWLIQRGLDTGNNQDVMQKVCLEILASGQFAGRDFSSADDYIFRCAHNASGPGNAAVWRSINTTHHITRVVADVGNVRGFEPKRAKLKPLAEQLVLLPI